MSKINSLIQYIKSFVFAHKIWTLIIVIIVLFTGYKLFWNKTTTETRYVTNIVTKGTIVSTVSGSGQVEASNSIDLKSKISGTITSVNVKTGQVVKKGQTLFSIDAQDAQKAVRDAELNLEIAKNDLVNAKKDFDNIKISQELSLSNLLSDLNSSVVAIPDSNNANTNIINISGSYTSTIQGRYILEVYTCQNSSGCIKYSGLETGTFSIATNIPKNLGERGLFVSFTTIPKVGEKWYIDLPSQAASSYSSSLRAYEDGKISVPKAIDTAKQNVIAKELAVRQRENSLIDAKQLLSNYYVTAPFDGTIATVVGKLGDMSQATLGTIITKENLASITLNEVDVSKISLGQKATLTYDAVSELSVAGEVVEIDGVGTVTQGVVSYKVKISFSTSDIRIKPGMSVSAAVITSVAQNVLMVPNSAIKNKNGNSYVELFDKELSAPLTGIQGSPSTTLPKQQNIEVGISNDTTSEVKSGLTEGMIVVTKTITSTTSATTAAPSLLGSGRGSIGGGAVRSATGR